MVINMKKELKEIRFTPAVFACGNNYEIIVLTKSEILLSIKIGDSEYFDHSGGIRRSLGLVHKIKVPISKLDEAGMYTLRYRKIKERKPYFTQSEETVEISFNFVPVRKDGDINIYILSDTHGNYEYPAMAGKYFGDDIDLLILNGDINDSSDNIKNFDLMFALCEEITKGEHPCIFSRGNHDLRGRYAEMLENYTPNENGTPYYTFRLGKIWGIVLDCGEDKPDSHPEYGSTDVCHIFRKAETEFIKKVIENRKSEYMESSAEYRIVISHIPFCLKNQPPFDIEGDIYREWLKLIGENIKPHLMISGHLHKTVFSDKKGALDSYGLLPCPIAVSGMLVRDDAGQVVGYKGLALTVKQDGIGCQITDHSGKTYDKMFIEK